MRTTRARIVVLFSVVLNPSALAEAQLPPDRTSEIKKVVKQCVEAVRAGATQGSEFYNFDAFYNSATGRVENNVTMQGERKGLFLFNKCMSEKGYPLGSNSAPPDPDIPPATKRLTDEAQKQAASDFKGARGQNARETCGQKLGITAAVSDGRDVARLYGAQKAIAWTDCVVDTLYPDPAKR